MASLSLRFDGRFSAGVTCLWLWFCFWAGFCGGFGRGLRTWSPWTGCWHGLGVLLRLVFGWHFVSSKFGRSRFTDLANGVDFNVEFVKVASKPDGANEFRSLRVKDQSVAEFEQNTRWGDDIRFGLR